MSIFSKIAAEFETLWADVFGKEGATISADVVTDIQLIGSGLSGALAAFESATGIEPATVTKIETTIASIKTAAESVVSTIETNVAKPIITQIVADFTSLKTAVTGLALPAVVSEVLNAVSTLLPFVEAAVGMLTAETVGAAEATGLSQDEARLILKGS